MGRPPRLSLISSVVVSMVLASGDRLRADGGDQSARPNTSDTRTRQPEAIVLGAIRANPLLAPYPIKTSWRDGAVVLSGKVGTTQLHTMVIRTALDLGYPIHDELVIDTAEAHRVAAMQTPGLAPNTAGGLYLGGSAPYFVYPPPLFGRVDDPFFGYEPPLVSFPPWWTPRTREPVAGSGPTGRAPTQLDSMPSPVGPRGRQPGAGMIQGPPPPAPAKGTIQLTVDSDGQVYLSGVVASEADRRTIEEEARSVPGVSRVISDLRVETRRSDTPPPPPRPFVPPPPPIRQAPPPHAAPKPRGPTQSDLPHAKDSQQLTRRVAEALVKRPVLAKLPISVQSRGDVVTISGTVPSAFEAMIAYRAVEQTPGVKEVIDRLEFQLPDENHPNPLRQNGRPEDLEAYLMSQIRRHVGQFAHVDRVRVLGDLVEIRGSLLHADDKERLEATLRSIPLLRDFRLESRFTAD